ncbi:hypothetical protein J7T55_004616 [Diaporthe amygdali]|uniref:uncharacterized protein n=1 Tax=Phomopsis amygdali TaxID=1214568 RepID=UPI0022FE6F37|nr:uncharacterized protein J7T55_004616 [Diaporthe amygdali]KAJ0114874.1 hypothetical protein J7T55_004616 [Diaporthe amygdali]
MASASIGSETTNDGENRIMGMMVGSAVADAAGIYTTNLTKDQAVQAYPERRILASVNADEVTHHLPDPHRAKYEDGNWSEATEMALCTLLYHTHGVARENLARRLRQLSFDGNRAYDMAPLDLGQPIKGIVESPYYLNDPEVAAKNAWVNANKGANDTNGSNAPLLRIHPFAAIATRRNLYQSLKGANVNCRDTHVDSKCNVSVMMATALLRGLLRREVQTEQQINPLLQRCKDHIDLMAFQKYPSLYTDNTKPTPIPFLRMNYGVGSRSELSRLLSAETLEELQLDDKRQSGEVWRCLAAGIFSLRTAMVRLEGSSGQNCEELRKTLFEELITDLIFQGGDAQANATFAGALLGAYLGYDAIPEQWREGLSDSSLQ